MDECPPLKGYLTQPVVRVFKFNRDSRATCYLIRFYVLPWFILVGVSTGTRITRQCNNQNKMTSYCGIVRLSKMNSVYSIVVVLLVHRINQTCSLVCYFIIYSIHPAIYLHTHTTQIVMSKNPSHLWLSSDPITIHFLGHLWPRTPHKSCRLVLSRHSPSLHIWALIKYAQIPTRVHFSLRTKCSFVDLSLLPRDGCSAKKKKVLFTRLLNRLTYQKQTSRRCVW